MKTSINKMASVAGAFVLLGLGFPLFFLLGNESCLAEENIQQTMMTLAIIVGAELCSAIFIAYLYDRWVYVKSFEKGAINGAWLFSLFAFNGALIYAFICLNYQLGFTAATGITMLSALILYTICTMFRGALAGGVMGWMLGQGNEANNFSGAAGRVG